MTNLDTEIEIFLPWPPTVNSYYAHTRNGVFISKKGRAYRKLVEDDLAAQNACVELDGPLYVEVVLHPPDRRGRDLDNYMKALLDACTKGGLWEDDKLIDQLEIRRGEVTQKGLVVMRITDAGPVIPLSISL